MKKSQYSTYDLFHGEYCTKFPTKHQSYWHSFYANISIIHFQEIILYHHVISVDIGIESINRKLHFHNNLSKHRTTLHIEHLLLYHLDTQRKHPHRRHCRDTHHHQFLYHFRVPLFKSLHQADLD
jgi:hypothetical protein